MPYSSLRALKAVAALALLARGATLLADRQGSASSYDVRAFGAKGDGAALDSEAINLAIQAAAKGGGGTVRFPAGTYRSTSIRLRSDVSLYLEPGATLLAAKRGPGVDYDPPEANPSNRYQDYGHTYFHNSLIWGEGLENVAILGQGMIDGAGLVSDYTRDPKDGNKAIALKSCRHVLIRDVAIRHGGWFAILATGVDHLTLDNLIIDTNRDGMDIDCCRDVHVSNCSVNSPNDDGICLKSTYALGEARPCENVTIANCHLSGFDEGTFLDGTYGRKGTPTGRIKFGTESNGGFKNIAIANCVFDYSRGFALETVDGGLLEDVTISNVVMRDIVNAPFFFRLASRLRGPDGVAPGALRRVSVSNVRVMNAAESSIIAGVPGHPIEGVTFSDIRIFSRGGAPASQAENVPPEDEKGYPEPGSLGKMPSYGFFVRHAKDVEFHDVEIGALAPDGRPSFALDDVDGADFAQIKTPNSARGRGLWMKNVRNLSVRMFEGHKDARKALVDKGKL